MSYHFYMSFIKAENLLHAFTLTHTLAKSLVTPAHAQARLKSNLSFAALSFHSLSGDPNRPFDPDEDSFREYLSEWVKALFQVRAVYWPEHHLLGFPGELPEGVLDGLSQPIYFQNGTDQDYDPSIWPKIDVFEKIIEQVGKLSDREVCEERWGSFEEEQDVEYARRSLIYERIFNALDLDNWLYGREGRFERMCMSGITTTEKAFEINTMAVAMARWTRR